ncbi:proline dehydrogenase family protein [Tumebacillus permanentifrigoris]|nr:proline dehydrogenase family protein [Tumebacillus permanentifrigoris]
MVLSVAGNKVVSGFIKKYGMRLGAARFVAGETLKEAIEQVKLLNRDGLVVTLDHLGEFVFDEHEAMASTQACLDVLDAVKASGVNSNMSLKMTSLGLDLSKELCLKHMRLILDKAREHNNFVRIDMEDYAHIAITMEIFDELKREYGKHVGLVIQAYLFRTVDDMKHLEETYENCNLRLVKGAYLESPTVAFPNKVDVDQNYLKIIEMHLLSGHFSAVATHDDMVINHVKAFVKKHNIPNDRFEFQMLYGVRPETQRQLVKEGYAMRVYVPYGNDWYGYFTRRIAERPANAFFIIKNMFRK